MLDLTQATIISSLFFFLAEIKLYFDNNPSNYVLSTMLAWEEEDMSDTPENSSLFGKDVIKMIKLC